jgi:hypothetical protein
MKARYSVSVTSRSAKAKGFKPDAVARQLVVEREALATVTDLCQPAGQLQETHWCSGARRQLRRGLCSGDSGWQAMWCFMSVTISS